MAKGEETLGGGDFDGVRRTQLADAISQEFNVRVRDVRRACDLRLEQERATHRVELEEQRVELLKVLGWGETGVENTRSLYQSTLLLRCSYRGRLLSEAFHFL